MLKFQLGFLPLVSVQCFINQMIRLILKGLKGEKVAKSGMCYVFGNFTLSP